MIEDAKKDIIVVRIGDREFDTQIDAAGVQRFIPNAVTAHLVQLMLDDFIQIDGKGFNLNDMIRLYHEELFPEEDWLTFYTSFGYSVSGFADLSFFQHLPIVNPIWEVCNEKQN